MGDCGVGWVNIVFAKHDGVNKKFCWSVPDGLVDKIKKGDILLVDTVRGVQIAIATSGVISGEGASDVAQQAGAICLKSVISAVDDRLYRYVHEKVVSEIIETLRPLPF